MKDKDPLAPYKEKRNFSLTPEPTGGKSNEKTAQAFVVQKHDARRTHYDLRLELNGVLKSWAVPKGLSLVAFTEWTKDHKVRHGAFKGLRTDKEPVQIIRELPTSMSETGSAQAASLSRDNDETRTPGKTHITSKLPHLLDHSNSY